MQASSLSLKQSGTEVPCFGGFDCPVPREPDLYDALIFNYAAPPQMLMYGDSLINSVKDFITRMGYGDHSVRGPATEVRVIGGRRERVTVVYIGDNISNPLSDTHLEIIRRYIDQRAPIGSNIIIEVA